MKKYFLPALFVLAVACNNNTDQKAAESTEVENSNTATAEANKENKEITAEYAFHGKYEIIDYKVDNQKVVLPKLIIEFTKNGDVKKPDGVSFFYKINKDSISYTLDGKTVIATSKITYLDADKKTFTLYNPKDKTEYTYKKVN